MTEVRTTSRTGGQKGVKPQRHSLIPKDGLDTIAEVFAFGAEKYADHNWRKGYEWSKSYDALIRHLTAWFDGEDLDPESGLSHLGHAGFHIMALATWQRQGGRYLDFDDRYRPEETAAEEEERLLQAEPDLLPPPRDILLCADSNTLEVLPHLFDDDGDVWQEIATGLWHLVGHDGAKEVASVEELISWYGIDDRPYPLGRGAVRSEDWVADYDAEHPQPLGPGWRDVGYLAADGIEWRDPAPRTQAFVDEARREAVSHFTMGADGVPRVNVPYPRITFQDRGSEAMLRDLQEQVNKTVEAAVLAENYAWAVRLQEVSFVSTPDGQVSDIRQMVQDALNRRA